MNRISKPTVLGKARRQKPKAGERSSSHGWEVPVAVRAPVYAASIGLFAVYAWGYAQADLGWVACGLVGVTAMAELIKPQLGELAAKALEAGDRASQCLIAAAALVCVLLGAAGGVVAMNVADAPRARYAAAERVVAEAHGAVIESQVLVDGMPSCSPDMPASRCDRMIRENAPILADRRARLASAHAVETEAREALLATPSPGPGLPFALWTKALFVGGAELVMFCVPFAAMRLRRRASAGSTAEVVEPFAGARPCGNQESTPAVKVNSGGWKTRLERYGPTGRKQKRGTHLKVVGAR